MSDLTIHTPKLHSRFPVRDGEQWFFHWCEGCKEAHSIPTPRWSFDGNYESPTFTPSVKNFTPGGPYCCHYNLTAGKIIYHGDCSHELRGQTRDMLPIPEGYGT